MRQRSAIPRTAESDDSDEENIQTAHPDEEVFAENDASTGKAEEVVCCREPLQRFFVEWLEGTTWWAQCLTITFAAVLTYSYNNSPTPTNVQIAIMTVITLAGASPFSLSHLLTASIGAFVGGHNIINATGLDQSGATEMRAVNYLWLCLLAFAVGLIWCFVMKKRNILDGYAGRLGTTTFVGMNAVMLLIYGPFGVVDWNRYYFGFVHWVHVAEEDSASSFITSAWKWTEEAELAIGYIGAVVWLSVVAGATRILHHRHVIQQWKNTSPHPHRQQPPLPLNNVLTPCLLALLSMLLVNISQYQHAPGLYNGFAVGAYVAMASLQKIPTIRMFATVGLVAAAWGLVLTPFFVGFAGKSGFTAMSGHVTHSILLEPLLGRLLAKKQQAPQPQSTQHLAPPKSGPSQQQHQDPDQPKSPQRKHPKPKEIYYTKQQRRQQQRLQHLQKAQQHQQQPLLHHRAWSAVPKEGDDEAWQHPAMGNQGSSTNFV